MKYVSVVITLALAFAGTACGPEEIYCYKEHTTCEQARLDKEMKEKEDRAREEAARDAQGILGDAGASSSTN